VAACSRKKNTFLSRNYHAVTAEYNALYNGNVAFDQGQQELSLTYRDNYWEILPIERFESKEEISLPGQTNKSNGNFERSEEKAVKAIQKHAIYIDGKEYNPQIDEAYMLLGKSRYFDQRFIPALDAFNFILNKYPTSNNINRAKVWKAKTNIRLNNEEVALENLTRLIKQAKLDDQELAEASAIMAQAYINLDSLEAAVPHIVKASEYTKDNELKGRYTYIKGQIFDRLGETKRANLAFDEVIALNRKSPRIYYINAHIEKAKNFDYEKEDKIAFLELLQDLEKDRENRPYLDKIYNQFGAYYQNTQSIDTAIVYYNESIRYYNNDKNLQAVNYQTLAEIYFDRAEYKNAGAYYDSTLTQLSENTRPWRRIKKKRENLADVIKYEDIAYNNDSILRFVNMGEEQQRAYFTQYTVALKKQAIEDSLSKIKEEKEIANNEFYKKQKSNTSNQGGSFYFYNSSTVAYGRQEFARIWGNRSLEDNWRRSSKKAVINPLEEENNSRVVPIAEDEKFNPDTYISRIPTDPVVIDSITKERDFAYYQLGLIYKEKFKEYELAANRLETLLSNNPEERLVLPAKYNLYKIYGILGVQTKEAYYKNDIIDNHPNSRYAEILINPETQLATDESSPEYKYKVLYESFEKSEYGYVIETCDAYITMYYGNDIVPKLEMLKASALGRQDGFEAYKKALNFVALNYPNSEEGKQAQLIYATVLPDIESKVFLPEAEGQSWKLVYYLNKEDQDQAKKLKEKVDEAVDYFKYDYMTTSKDYYTPEQEFIIIHGMDSELGAKGFAEILSEHKNFKIKYPYFAISSPNYKIVQIHKNLDEYLNPALRVKEAPKKASKVDPEKTRNDIKAKAKIKASKENKSSKSGGSKKSSKGKGGKKEGKKG